jgi:hypothetical protein
MTVAKRWMTWDILGYFSFPMHEKKEKKRKKEDVGPPMEY